MNLRMKRTKKKPIRFFLFLTAFILSLTSCTDKRRSVVSKANKLAKSDVGNALLVLDRSLQSATTSKDKLYYLKAIEEIVKKDLKDPKHYKAVLEKKIFFSENEKERNKSFLTLAQLLIQNFRDENEALSVLSKINFDKLIGEDRAKYFQSILISHINLKEDEQALIEVKVFLNRKDLTPSEDFKIRNLKSRSLVNLKKIEEAEKEYMSLIETYPNLSKKWNIRSQLGLLLEEQKEYKKAIFQLKKQVEESDVKDPLLEWRIAELSKRMEQQPGGKGRLRR